MAPRKLDLYRLRQPPACADGYQASVGWPLADGPKGLTSSQPAGARATYRLNCYSVVPGMRAAGPRRRELLAPSGFRQSFMKLLQILQSFFILFL
ncbi:MAG: hypothetical protein D6791_14540 [Chloroflexi bacterium]|nr:MAG: hypothetical protein D6791_14540 [Chloroflexota bacterium]